MLSNWSWRTGLDLYSEPTGPPPPPNIFKAGELQAGYTFCDYRNPVHFIPVDLGSVNYAIRVGEPVTAPTARCVRQTARIAFAQKSSAKLFLTINSRPRPHIIATMASKFMANAAFEARLLLRPSHQRTAFRAVNTISGRPMLPLILTSRSHSESTPR